MDQKASLTTAYPKQPMIGFNTLTICQAEMYAVLQHYIDCRFGANIASVKQFKVIRDSHVTTFEIGLLWDNTKT
jgi:hypothetical protein